MTASGERRERYLVGDLRIDASALLVVRNGEELPLPRLSFDLLIHLVRKAPQAVSCEDLLETVWRGVVVEPQTVRQRVRLLRERLGDDPRQPRYIGTARGLGYRLVPRPIPLVTDGAYRLTRRLLDILDFTGRAGGGATVLTAVAILALLVPDRDDGRLVAMDPVIRVCPDVPGGRYGLPGLACETESPVTGIRPGSASGPGPFK